MLLAILPITCAIAKAIIVHITCVFHVILKDMPITSFRSIDMSLGC